MVAAGSSVVNTLLPVPAEYSGSKRGLRQFYHEKFSPASDVDLFLYGLTEEEAVEKIKSIETAVRDVLLTETTTVRTKHAVTICKWSQTISDDYTFSNTLKQAANIQLVISRFVRWAFLTLVLANKRRLSSASTTRCLKF